MARMSASPNSPSTPVAAVPALEQPKEVPQGRSASSDLRTRRGRRPTSVGPSTYRTAASLQDVLELVSAEFNRHIRRCRRCHPPSDLCELGHELDWSVSDLAAARILGGLK